MPPQQKQSPIKTLVIDNFTGSLTRYVNGDINSGKANFTNTNGMIPFANPGQLSWQEKPVQIDPNGSVITDLIMCGKERVESGISYVYCVGHTGRVYKIQVNNPSVFNPNYDNPVLLATLSAQSPTFTRGGSIEFYGTTERMFIGSDMGVTRLDFDGTNETFIGSVASWVQNVPRPIKEFSGILYIGNGNNIAKIDGTLTVASYTWLSPGFPSNTQVRDEDISPDGNYLEVVVSRLALADQTVKTQDTTIITNSESYLYRWNGTDMAATSYTIFPSYSLTANRSFGDFGYTFGYDIAGGSVFNPVEKVLSPSLTGSPSPNAVVSDGNIVGWSVPEFNNGFNKLSAFLYGSFDSEIGTGWWREFQMAASGTETDIINNPFALFVSNFGIGASTNGYTNGVFSGGKVYFSTLEASNSTTKYKFYKFFTTASGFSTPLAGTYQTQTQLFSKKIIPVEVRIYGKPWIANNTFTISLIGSSGSAIANTSKTFTAGTNLTVGSDFAWYNPAPAPTYALGLSIANSGTANMTINKVEIDYAEAGK